MSRDPQVDAAPVPEDGTKGTAGLRAGAIPAPASEETLEAVVARISSEAILPPVSRQIMDLAADPKAGAETLPAVVEADPALAGRVLRCVNSVPYGRRIPVSNLKEAASYLGFHEIRDLAVTATVSAQFTREQRVHGYDRRNLWRHLVAVGVCSRLIANRTKTSGFEDAYLAGLLHDLGLALFDQHLHSRFRRVIAGLSDSTSLIESERRVVPWDHTELGERVASAWGLPDPVRFTIAHHHAPQEYGGVHEALVHCVAVANLVCSLKGISSVGRNLLELSPSSLVVLGLDRSDLQILAEDLDAELAAHQALFDIQRGL